MTQDELEDRLLLAMLKRSREGEGTLFNLKTLCLLENIPMSSDQLIAFTRDTGTNYGSSRSTLSDILFEISANGLRNAKDVENRLRPRTLGDILSDDKFQKIGNISISLLSFLVSIGALTVAVIALGKGG